MCYLTEEDLVSFLIKCKMNLRDEKSIIIIKENVSDSGVIEDENDSSIARSDSIFKEIFEKAGLDVIKHIY